MTSKFALCNSVEPGWCLYLCVCVWTHLDIAHLCPGCVCSNSACVCWGVRQWRDRVCVCMRASTPFPYIWGEHPAFPLFIPHLFSNGVCAALYVRTRRTLFAFTSGMFAFIVLSFVFPPRDGKLVVTCSTNATQARHKVPRHFSVSTCVRLLVCVCMTASLT